jgi:hypothetical protein
LWAVIQILDLFFSISLLLPRPVGAEGSENWQASYAAVTSLEDLIAVTNWVSMFILLHPALPVKWSRMDCIKRKI